MPAVDSCINPVCFSCPFFQFAVALEGKSVVSVAGTVPAADLGNRDIVEVLAAAFAEASAVEVLAVGCSGRTDSIAVELAAGLVAGNHYHKTIAGLAAALATAQSDY